MSKKLLALFGLVVFMCACEFAPKITPTPTVISTMVPLSSVTPEPPKIWTGNVNSNDVTLADVFERLTGKVIGQSSDFIYCWISQKENGQVICFAGKDAFVWARAVIYLPDLWENDLIYISFDRGAINQELLKYSDVLYISASSKGDSQTFKNTKYITVSGGYFKYPLIFSSTSGDNDWTTVIHDASVITATQLKDLMSTGLNSQEAVDQLLNQ
jgi:hypothetical protein